ncbi:hypothetical protein CORAM0001_0571 [Corynebacterium amycolatum SK46]|nr:hypothetical protein CORAM0001_0571 [Corynebacterium amycolatum SK46]
MLLWQLEQVESWGQSHVGVPPDLMIPMSCSISRSTHFYAAPSPHDVIIFV